MKKPIAIANQMPVGNRDALYDLVSQWHEASIKEAQAKEKVESLRLKIVDQYFLDCPEGTNTLDLGFGKKLVCDIKINRTVNEDELHAAATANPKIALLAANVICYKPNLSIGGWKALSPEERSLFGEIIVEKPGKAALKLADKK